MSPRRGTAFEVQLPRNQIVTLSPSSHLQPVPLPHLTHLSFGVFFPDSSQTHLLSSLPCHHLLAGEGTETLEANSLGQNPILGTYYRAYLVQGEFVMQLQATKDIPSCITFKTSVLPSGAPQVFCFASLSKLIHSSLKKILTFLSQTSFPYLQLVEYLLIITPAFK